MTSSPTGSNALRRFTLERAAILCSTVAAVMAGGASVRAHNGPPYPVVSNQVAGNYEVSLWADPDATDNGSADGRFWVMVQTARPGAPLPPDTRVKVSIWPGDDPASIKTESAGLVEHESSRWFVAFVIDHEGRYGVKATIEGPLGPADVETIVDAEYDQRPRPIVVVLFVMPFVLVGFVWLKLLLRRRSRGV